MQGIPGVIQLLNDNITGDGEGDDEELVIQLLTVPQNITKLLFVVTIDCGQEQKQDFSQAANAFWRILDNSNPEVLLHCSLSNPVWQGVTLLAIAALERMDTQQWQLVSCLEVSPQKNLNELLHVYS